MSNFYINNSIIKKLLIVGFGITGKSVNNFLSRYNKLDIDICYNDKDFLQYKLANYDLIVVSPGIPLNKPLYAPLAKHKNKIISDIDIFHQEIKNKACTTIAITGSNGKSTIVTMLSHILKHLGYDNILVGNIGTAPLDKLGKEFKYCITEISSFQIDLLKSARFDIGCVVNISQDHLDRYENFAEYKQAKLNLEKFSKDFITYDIDNKGVKYTGNYKVIKDSVYKGSTKIVNITETNLFGRHNLENIIVVLNILDKLKIDNYKAIQALKTFIGLEHRCKVVKSINNITYINDSKGTNIDATITALNSISNTKNIILLLGGVAKNADFSLMNSILEKYVKFVCIYGQDKEYIEKQIKISCKYQLYNSMYQAFDAANKKAQENDIILLSPACASFDEFKNYSERGKTFEKLVLQLKQDNQGKLDAV